MSQNKLPTSKTAIRKVETLAERYILLESLLFKITPEKESAVLAVPETCIDKIIPLYHPSLFAGHQGVIKTYLTISDNFFIPNLIHYLKSYIKDFIYASQHAMKSHQQGSFKPELTQIIFYCED